MEPLEIGATYRIIDKMYGSVGSRFIVIFHGRSTHGRYIIEQPAGSINYYGSTDYVSPWEKEVINRYKWEVVPHGTLK